MSKNTSPETLDTIPASIESLTGLRSVNTITHAISVSLSERDVHTCPFSDALWKEFFHGVDEKEYGEVVRTMDFFYTKFEKLFPRLEEAFDIDAKKFLSGLANRLAEQIREAKISGRKFTNGTVGSLKSIDENGNFTIEKIPYWTFGASNVSLDMIKYPTSQGQKSLRDIMESFDESSEDGEFLLPNSLGVSVMIQLADGTIIAQKRNNKVVLTQYAGVTSSASGAVSLMADTKNGGTEILNANAVAEVSEELGLHPERIPHLPDLTGVIGSIQERILHELNIEWGSGVLVPVGVVMERKRHNPEVVFTMVLREGITLDDIRQKWENADDKWESIDLVGKTPEQIEQDIAHYARHIPDALRRDANGLEKFIQTLPQDQEWTGPHLLMSYLAWKKAIEGKMEKYKDKASKIITD